VTPKRDQFEVPPRIVRRGARSRAAERDRSKRGRQITGHRLGRRRRSNQRCAGVVRRRRGSVEFAPPRAHTHRLAVDSRPAVVRLADRGVRNGQPDASREYRRLRGRWWTHDGWDRFNDAQTTSPALDDAIETAWDSFQAETEFDAFVDELQEHPWIQPASEFGSNVRPAFESKYITPLRRAASWHEDISDAVSTVIGGTTHTEADGFIRATNTLLDSEPSLWLQTATSTDYGIHSRSYRHSLGISPHRHHGDWGSPVGSRIAGLGTGTTRRTPRPQYRAD